MKWDSAQTVDTTIVPIDATPSLKVTVEGQRSVGADGHDWILVPEGAQYTPEQAVRRFLSLRWEDKVARMAQFLESENYLMRMAMMNQDIGVIPLAGVHVQD